MTMTLVPAGSVQVVRTESELARVRWFQLQRYFDAGMLDDMPTELPADPLIASSTYFAAYSPSAEIWGTGRLIAAENEDLPVIRDHSIAWEYQLVLEAERDQVCEISRVAVSPHAPQVQTFAALGREMFRHCAERQQNTIWLGSIGLPMMHMLERILGIPFEIMGPVVHDYYNEDSYPVLMDTVRYMYECRGEKLWNYITDGLVIDLRSGREPIVVEPKPPNLKLMRIS